MAAMQILLACEPIKDHPEVLEICKDENLKVENLKIILEKQVEPDVDPDNHEAQIAYDDVPVTANSKEESCIEDANGSLMLDGTSLTGDSNIEGLFERQNTNKYDKEDGNISTVQANAVINLTDKTIITANILDSYNADIFLTTEEILCPLCLQLCPPGDAMLLQNCSDPVCKKCMTKEILTSDYSLIKCPYYNCSGILNHCEIRCLLSTDDFETFIQRSVRSVKYIYALTNILISKFIKLAFFTVHR